MASDTKPAKKAPGSKGLAARVTELERIVSEMVRERDEAREKLRAAQVAALRQKLAKDPEARATLLAALDDTT